MGDKNIQNDFKTQEQKLAVCFSRYKKKKAKASLVIKAAGEEYLVMSSERPTKLSVPENWDKMDDYSTRDFACYAGANDWENSLTACAFVFGTSAGATHGTRVWGHMADQEESPDHKTNHYGHNVIKGWVDAAKAARDIEYPGTDTVNIRPEHFMKVAPDVVGLTGYGVEKIKWEGQDPESYAANTDPIDDNSPPVKNPNPPAAPFPAKVAPKSSQPKSEDGKEGGKNATDDDLNNEYVGGRKVEPAKLPNPEPGGADPNPDNDHALNNNAQTPDSFDDKGNAKPDLEDLNWFLGKTTDLDLEKDEQGMAKWPLKFKKIEKDFKRPNKTKDPNSTELNGDPQHPRHPDVPSS